MGPSSSSRKLQFVQTGIEELRVVVVLVVARDVHRVPAMILYFEEVRRHKLGKTSYVEDVDGVKNRTHNRTTIKTSSQQHGLH